MLRLLDPKVTRNQLYQIRFKDTSIPDSARGLRNFAIENFGINYELRTDLADPGKFWVVDEKKYLLFLLKYGAVNV